MSISNTTDLRYGPDYGETVKLRDGTKAHLRPIRPDDKAIVLEGFERLSEQSRYTRFLAPKSTLTERELAYLTEVDGVDHFAILATNRKLLGGEEGLGVGRFVRLPNAPEIAEPAVTVADDQQGKGLGTILLNRLCEAAWERGIRMFRSELLAGNSPMKDLIEDISPEATFTHLGDGIMAATFNLPHPAPEEQEREHGLRASPLFRLFSAIAGNEGLEISQRNTLPPEPPSS